VIEHTLRSCSCRKLWREDGLSFSPTLVTRAGVEAPTVTKALKRLERAGFVLGTMDPRRSCPYPPQGSLGFEPAFGKIPTTSADRQCPFSPGASSSSTRRPTVGWMLLAQSLKPEAMVDAVRFVEIRRIGPNELERVITASSLFDEPVSREWGVAVSRSRRTSHADRLH
jgi:hypothetical protein